MLQQNENLESYDSQDVSSTLLRLELELSQIFEREEVLGIPADPELVSQYLAAIEKIKPHKCFSSKPYEDFEKTWIRFVTNHPDLFPPQ